MKWDFAIGNPPYQEEGNLKHDLSDDSKRNYAPPVYHSFLDESYKIADVVEMIHPARFLFNAGSTPKNWNDKMLHDEHLKISFYESDSSKVFPGLSTIIKGGVAVSYRDSKQVFGAIEAFTQYNELNAILHKVINSDKFLSLSEIVFSRTSYRLTDVLHKDNPWAIERLSDGHKYDMSSNIITLLPELFLDEKPKNKHEYIKILGRTDNKRVYKYIKREYVNTVDNLYAYKVILPQATGTGIFGEPFSSPFVEECGVGTTETFIGIGNFERIEEADSLRKYICTKFARAMLGILKVTPMNNKPVWKYVPLQDFTDKSDINWNTSIANIDKQLYKKYGLSQEEIDFIETHVKEME